MEAKLAALRPEATYATASLAAIPSTPINLAMAALRHAHDFTGKLYM